mmetsp:Transcript_21811/g.72117  ORF Transcript_21811/g.72117 Transcript_21811/m.72117 type:complete len:234 (-) Transcript_21811:77-778(-)
MRNDRSANAINIGFDPSMAHPASKIYPVALVCPRRKKSMPKKSKNTKDHEEPVALTYALLESFFRYPLAVVSKKLSICPTAIKKACRKLGIEKWPFKSPNPGPKKRRSTKKARAREAAKKMEAEVSSSTSSMQSPSSFQSSEEDADALAFLQCADSMECSQAETDLGEVEEKASTLNWLPPCYESDNEGGSTAGDFWGACAVEVGMLESTDTEIELREQECLKLYMDTTGIDA